MWASVKILIIFKHASHTSGLYSIQYSMEGGGLKDSAFRLRGEILRAAPGITLDAPPAGPERTGAFWAEKQYLQGIC